MQKIHLKRTKRILAGHLWVFSNEIAENLKHSVPGSIVELYDAHETYLGKGYINPQSLISVRILTHGKEDIGLEFIKKRLQRAIDLRQRILPDIKSCRIVYSEGDFLPGLIIDKFGGTIVIQSHTLGMDKLIDLVVQAVDEMLAPDNIVIRNDSKIRQLEGVESYKKVVKGTLDKLPVIEESGANFEIDPIEGQKTGFFLDHRPNRLAFKELVKEGMKGLDLFCYTGAWGLPLAKIGAKVTFVDDSSKSSAWITRNAELSGIDKANIGFEKADVFKFLEAELLRGERRYDFIALDPPAFVKSASKIKEAIKAYRELNTLCMRLLKFNGLLATSSCSYHMGREMFIELLAEAGKHSGRTPRKLFMGTQGMDHPALISMPETEYLKCAILTVI